MLIQLSCHGFTSPKCIIIHSTDRLVLDRLIIISRSFTGIDWKSSNYNPRIKNAGNYES